MMEQELQPSTLGPVEMGQVLFHTLSTLGEIHLLVVPLATSSFMAR